MLGAWQRKDGYIEGGGYVVSWCFGHLMELAQAGAYDEKYEKWRYEDLPIIPEDWKYAVSKDKEKQLKILASLMKRPDVDTIVNACDAGREGELIFRLVYDYCKCKKPIQRLWISSMEETAIAEGFRNLRPGAEYDALYRAALCRAQADYVVGINMTRLFSVLYKGSTLNVGRVQTPTLALIVRRAAEIAAFVKEPFYTPEIELGGFTASGEKMKDKAAAEGIRAACDGKTAAAVSVKRQEKSAAPPKLYDLTTLQREANRLYGYTAQQTLDYVQSLYEKKLATYPRTDSRYLTADMAAGLPALVSGLAAALPFMKGLETPVDASRVVDDSKVSDHHAIIPTASMPKADLSALPEGEGHILHMLAARLICAVGEKHIFAETSVVIDCAGHSFAAKGRAVLAPGWKAVEAAFRSTLKSKPENEVEDEKTLPDISEGQVFESVRASVREGLSSPPKHFTEDSLLAAMENAGAEYMLAGGLRPDDAERKGLGTPATRAGIIEKLVRGGFVERRQKNLIPAQKGINLIAVLPDTVKSPLLTAEWEQKLKSVECDEITADSFMGGIAAMTRGLVKEHSAPMEEYKALFMAPPGGEITGACPRCGGNVREAKKGFFCDNAACSFALWKDNRFFAAKKKTITKAVAAALLKEGRVFMSGLFSEKTGKTYDAYIALDDTGKYVNFKLIFEKEAKK
ncbi:DNA topoisomerase [Clostridia bacterium]|nr:DNA topoisomerase [Clostridia bacterium]